MGQGLNWYKTVEVNIHYGYELYKWTRTVTGLNYVTPLLMDNISELEFYIKLSLSYNKMLDRKAWVTFYNSKGEVYNLTITNEEHFENSGLEYLWNILHNVLKVRWVSIPDYFSYVSGNKAITYRLGCIGAGGKYLGEDSNLSEYHYSKGETISMNDVPFEEMMPMFEDTLYNVLQEGDRREHARYLDMSLTLVRSDTDIERINWYVIEESKVRLSCTYDCMDSIERHMEAMCMYNYNIYNPLEYYIKELGTNEYEVGVLVSDMYRDYESHDYLKRV